MAQRGGRRACRRKGKGGEADKVLAVDRGTVASYERQGRAEVAQQTRKVAQTGVPIDF